MLEYVCAENERDRTHMTGKLPADAVEASPGDLAKFVGTYTSPNPFGPGVIKSEVTLSGGQLIMDTPLGRIALRRIGDATFSASGTVVRFVEENGVMAAISTSVEADLKAVRQP
jgi:hypothetical protein